MHRFAETAEAIGGTSSKLKKIAFLADYLRTLSEDNLRAAAVFFTGRPFALTDARTLNVGWSALVNAVQELSGASDENIHQIYLDRGDLGEMAERLLPSPSERGREARARQGEASGKGEGPNPAAIQSKFSDLVKLSGASNKMPAVLDLLRSLAPVEVKYVIKIITGDLRIGLKENTVEEAIARAFDRPVDAVRRANMMLGDVGETAVLAKRGELTTIQLGFFRPVKFMLATQADTEDEIFATFPGPFYIEDKYDGIRGQLHASEGRAALYSRTLDDVGHQFPEIVETAQMLRDANSLYLPGKRGMSWLKWKKALATLDVVVTGVEFGHGRRRDVLSDYTFAVHHDGKLLNIGKAYSGLTDLEIAEMTEFFK